MAKIGLVHPQLPLHVCTTLGIPALEAVVAEELSPDCRPRRIASIQVLQTRQRRCLWKGWCLAEVLTSLSETQASQFVSNVMDWSGIKVFFATR